MRAGENPFHFLQGSSLHPASLKPANARIGEAPLLHKNLMVGRTRCRGSRRRSPHRRRFAGRSVVEQTKPYSKTHRRSSPNGRESNHLRFASKFDLALHGRSCTQPPMCVSQIFFRFRRLPSKMCSETTPTSHRAPLGGVLAFHPTLIRLARTFGIRDKV